MPVRPATMLRIQGYSILDAAPRSVTQVAQRMAASAQALFAPAVRYRLAPLRRVDGWKLLADGTAFCPGLEAATVLCGSAAVAVVLVTMGARLDEEIERFQSRGDLVEALFLETAGWLGIEAATRAFAARLRDRARAQGLSLTRRLAPGYGTWPLTGQRDLFAVFDGAALPVRLLESCAMTPKLSRSGVYGLAYRRPAGAVDARDA